MSIKIVSGPVENVKTRRPSRIVREATVYEEDSNGGGRVLATCMTTEDAELFAQAKSGNLNSAETEAELNCSRCLKSFKQPLLINIEENFEKDQPPVKGKKGGEIEIREEDFVSPIEKDNTIDISEVIRQNLLLALPIKPLCDLNCQEPKGQKDATTEKKTLEEPTR